MTHIVFHRGRTLLGACSVAAVMVFSQAGLAHGAGMGAAPGGGGSPPGLASHQPFVTPGTSTPHPFDPSGHMPGLSSPSGPGLATRTPITGSRIPVATTRQAPETNTAAPVTDATRPVADDQRPVVARHLYTPGQDLIAPPGVSNSKPVTEGTRPVADDQRPVVDRHLFTPGQDPTSPPTKVGGDPTTGTQIIDPPVKK